MVASSIASTKTIHKFILLIEVFRGDAMIDCIKAVFRDEIITNESIKWVVSSCTENTDDPITQIYGAWHERESSCYVCDKVEELAPVSTSSERFILD